jgi:hypothetical protein
MLGLSSFASVTILVWALEPSKKKPNPPPVSSENSERIDLAERIRKRRAEANDYREYARALDQDLMSTLEERREQKPVPGIKESRQRWRRKFETARRQVNRWRNAERGSIEWQEREEILKSLDDGPQ